MRYNNGMTRHFRMVDYHASLHSIVRLRDVLPADHLARFAADLVAQLNLIALDARHVLLADQHIMAQG